MRAFKREITRSSRRNGRKIKAIKQAAPTLLVIARTDAKSVNGMEDVIRRANLYVEAGADAIFPEALITAEDFTHASNHIKGPLLANMTEFGKTPYYHADEFSVFGFQMVIYPVSSLRVAAKAYERLFTEIMERERSRGYLRICKREKSCMKRFIMMNMRKWTSI